MFQSLIWIKDNKIDKVKNIKLPKIHIIIPALREQKRLLPTLDYFVKHFKTENTRLIIGTTQREFEKKFKGISTQDLIKKYITSKNLSNWVSIVDYPRKNGFMAHQLNYTISKIKDDNSYITVYNADSRPHPKTLKYFYNLSNKYPQLEAAQQSAVFLNNFDILGNNKNFLEKYIIKASAILQSRWTLAHEIPRLLRQSVNSFSLIKKIANAHVVGHGLIIKTKTIKRIGGFPSDSITEDLFLGYLLRSKGVNIYPIPLLELADNPVTIKGLFQQKYIWFWGPMGYWDYFIYVLKNKKKLKVKGLLVPLILSSQGILSALAWLVSGPMVFILLLSPILINNLPLIVFAYVSVFLYGFLQFFYTYLRIPFLFSSAGTKPIKVNIQEGIIASLFSYIAILFHSIPPYFSVASEIQRKLINKKISKPKTDD